MIVYRCFAKMERRAKPVVVDCKLVYNEKVIVPCSMTEDDIIHKNKDNKEYHEFVRKS